MSIVAYVPSSDSGLDVQRDGLVASFRAAGAARLSLCIGAAPAAVLAAISGG